MPQLAFLPWVSSDSPLTAGEFRLVPFVRGDAPAGSGTDLQATIDAVLEPYLNAAGQVVNRCTIISSADRPTLIADLSEDERGEYFRFADLLAFSALSARDYFRDTYTNRDAYRLVIQGFRPGSHSVLISSRRRDGSKSDIFTEGSYSERRPHHVPIGTTVLDLPLLEALLDCRARPEWPRIYESVVGFNLANSDSPAHSLETEALLAIGAVQRLLDCKGASIGELVERFTVVFKPAKPLSPTACPLVSVSPGVTDGFRRAGSIAEGWLRDFYALRGDVAHGKLGPRYPSIWSLREHLLLAAFAFPLLLKAVLASIGAYKFSGRDQIDVDLFEQLASQRHFDEVDEEAGAKHPWAIVRNPLRIAGREWAARVALRPRDDGAA